MDRQVGWRVYYVYIPHQNNSVWGIIKNEQSITLVKKTLVFSNKQHGIYRMIGQFIITEVNQCLNSQCVNSMYNNKGDNQLTTWLPGTFITYSQIIYSWICTHYYNVLSWLKWNKQTKLIRMLIYVLFMLYVTTWVKCVSCASMKFELWLEWIVTLISNLVSYRVDTHID